MEKIKILIVDDSPLMRKLLTTILSEEPGMEVVGTANNGRIALTKIGLLNPDVVTLDIQMPVMDGIETLKEIMTNFPLRVIMISSYTEAGANLTFKALELGAIDFITKPDSHFSRDIFEIKSEIIMKINAAMKVITKKINLKEIKEIEDNIEARGRSNLKKIIHPPVEYKTCKNLVTIGISTGGPEALKNILPMIPSGINAGILIVQHMPIGFTKAFAERMNAISAIDVQEAKDGDLVVPGRVLIVKGDYHLLVKEQEFSVITQLDHSEKVSRFRPSIDVLMQSSAKCFKQNNIGIIMTGMASDGVAGIRYIKEAGGKTIAQDKESSVVFGMNKLAIESGYVDQVLPLEHIVPAILNYLEQN